MTNFTAKLDLQPESKPKFFRPRLVPFALRDSIETESQRLEDAKIISKVSYSGLHLLLQFLKNTANYGSVVTTKLL